jgi:hypothetical protein
VDINPQKPVLGENPINTFPDTVYNGSANKSISKNPQYQPDNLQSTFPLPEGGRVTVEILYSEAAENSKIDLLLKQPVQQTLIEYANHNEGFIWQSPDYFANTNFEVGIYWYWEKDGTLYEGNEAGATVSSLGFGEYYIGFEAAGDDWDYNELVIKVTIETYLPLVLIDPPNISTGETAVVTIKKLFYDGRIEDFSAGQLFEFGMMEGCAAGVLVSGTDTSNYFNGVPQPILFVAADSIESDEETVKIGAGVIEQNQPAMMQTKPKLIIQSDKKILKDKKTTVNIDDTKINSIIIGNCFSGDFASEKRSDANIVVEDPLIIAWDQITHYINIIPEMPKLLTIWVKPKNYVGQYSIDWDLEVKWVSKEQSPDKTFTYTFHNSKTSSNPDGTDLPIPDNDNTIVGGDEITLTIKNYRDSNYPNGYKPKHSIKLKGMKILGDNGQNNVQMVKDYITAHDFPHPIDMPLSEEVTLQDQRKQMQVIVDKESSYFQFLEERYHPWPYGSDDFGHPNTQRNSGGAPDWGLCQLNLWEPSLGVMWNWKTNINAGIHFLWGTDFNIHKYAQVKREFNRLKKKYTDKDIVVRDPNRKEFLLMLSQHYKRGFYFVGYVQGNPRKNEQDRWDKTSIWKNYEYGDDFWTRFDK